MPSPECGSVTLLKGLDLTRQLTSSLTSCLQRSCASLAFSCCSSTIRHCALHAVSNNVICSKPFAVLHAWLNRWWERSVNVLWWKRPSFPLCLMQCQEHIANLNRHMCGNMCVCDERNLQLIYCKPPALWVRKLRTGTASNFLKITKQFSALLSWSPHSRGCFFFLFFWEMPCASPSLPGSIWEQLQLDSGLDCASLCGMPISHWPSLLFLLLGLECKECLGVRDLVSF